MKYLRWSAPVLFIALTALSFFDVGMAKADVRYTCSFTCAESVVMRTGDRYFRYVQHESPTQFSGSLTLEQCRTNPYTQPGCAGECRRICGGRNVNEGRTRASDWGPMEHGCLNTIPSYMIEATDVAKQIGDDTGYPIRGEALMDSAFRTRNQNPPPRCSQGAGDGPVTATPATGAAASQCTESTNIQNDQQGKCVFYCIRPEAGTGGTVERRETPLPQLRNGATVPGGTTTTSCRRGSLERREGTNACAVGSVCGCQQECMTTCGNASDGKSLCYMGTDNTRSVDLCRDNVSSEAATPICSRDPNAPVRGTQHTLTNPLGTSSIAAIVARIVKAVTGIVGSVALLMFVVAGIMWMTAESSDRVDTAKTIFKNASFGLVLIFFSYSLVSLLLSILGL